MRNKAHKWLALAAIATISIISVSCCILPEQELQEVKTPIPKYSPTPARYLTETVPSIGIPEPTTNPAIRRYLTELDELMTARYEHFLNLEAMLWSYNSNPTQYYSETWQDAFEYVILDWYDTTSSIYDLDAPPSLEKFHAEIKTAMLYDDRAQNEFLAWLDAGIPINSILDQATVPIEQSTIHIDNATRMREELGY